MAMKHIHVTIGQLLLDPNNYRFADGLLGRQIDTGEFARPEVQDAARDLLTKHHATKELQDSILENGWLHVDLIVVREYDTDKNGRTRYLVVEGNRRLASMLNLLDLYRIGRAHLDATLLEAMESLLVAVIQGEDTEVEHFSRALMGIRHVSGPKSWSGHQSARLISELSDSGRTYTEIGDMLGISSVKVGRRLRAYRVFLQMKEDIVFGVHVRANFFTLLQEVVGSPDLRNWLGWNSTTHQFDHDIHRQRLYRWIAGTPGESPRITNQTHVRNLKSFITSPAAVTALLEEKPWNEVERIRDLDTQPGAATLIQIALSALEQVESLTATELLNEIEQLQKLSILTTTLIARANGVSS